MTARSHLQQLEAESIHIMREVVAECQRPVLLYSIGKDSSVLLRLAQKAFFPGPVPFPLLHIDTGYKFKEMIDFRDRYTAELGLDLIVHTNRAALNEGANPFQWGTQRCCGALKTTALLDGLRQGGFDAAIGGARRDEERSRAKERVFSFRDQRGQWDPRNQRPELWNIFNTRIHPGESLRVFPLSNWTELDVWQYIHAENIPIVPLYFAKPRLMLVRGDSLLPVEQPFVPRLPGEEAKLVIAACARWAAVPAPALSVLMPTPFRVSSKNWSPCVYQNARIGSSITIKMGPWKSRSRKAISSGHLARPQ